MLRYLKFTMPANTQAKIISEPMSAARQENKSENALAEIISKRLEGFYARAT